MPDGSCQVSVIQLFSEQITNQEITSVYATVPLLRFASPEQKARYLPRIIQGTERTCFGVTEPNTGLDTLKLRTKAEKLTASQNGKSRYVVSGQKM